MFNRIAHVRDNLEYARAQRRAARVGVEDLLNWADLTGTGMARAVNDYRRHRDTAALAELKTQTYALAAIIEQLATRHSGAR